MKFFFFNNINFLLYYYMGAIFSSSKVSPNKENNTVNNTTISNTNKKNKLIIEGFNILQDICIINYNEDGKIFEDGFKPNKSTNTKNYIPNYIKNINLELYSIIIVCTQNSISGKKSSKKNHLQHQLKKYFKSNRFEMFSKVDATLMGNRYIGNPKNVRTRVYINTEKVKVNFDYKNLKNKSYGKTTKNRGSYTNERSSNSNNKIKGKDNDKKEIIIDSYKIFRKTAESNIRKDGAGIIYIKLNFLMSNNQCFPVIIVNNNIVAPKSSSKPDSPNKSKNNNVSINKNKLNDFIGKDEVTFYINYCDKDNSKYKILHLKDNSIHKLITNSTNFNKENTKISNTNDAIALDKKKYRSLVKDDDHKKLIEEYYDNLLKSIPIKNNNLKTNNSFVKNNSLILRKGLAKYIANRINEESNEHKEILLKLYKQLYQTNAVSILTSDIKKKITGTKMPKEMIDLFIQDYASAVVVNI